MKVASLTIFRVSAVARNSWQDCILRVWRKERKCGCEGRTAFWRVSRGWTRKAIGWILIRGQWIWERLRFWGWWVEGEILFQRRIWWWFLVKWILCWFGFMGWPNCGRRSLISSKKIRSRHLKSTIKKKKPKEMERI